MAGGVEFTGIPEFEAETERMPMFVLHELAHARHDRELPGGFENAELRGAHARAVASGKYDRVRRHNGGTRPETNERAYALESPMQFFAEITEAYFGRNDFFPFDRSDLLAHDPRTAALVARLWGVEGAAAPSAGAAKP
jgi:hypothetical protein